MDTLAFGYVIPAIRAYSGLPPVRQCSCRAYQKISLKNKSLSDIFFDVYLLASRKRLQQIELLKSRDLNIADSSKAAKFLGEVNYFRFVQYLRPMEADKSTHQFKPNSRFEDAVALFLEEVASCLLFISMIFKEFCDV